MNRIVVSVASVLLGMLLGGIVGGLLGAFIGHVRTRGCIEMDCLESGLWVLGGVLLGALAGGVSLPWWFRRH